LQAARRARVAAGALRAVGWTLKKERTAEWDAWNHHGWFTTLTKDEEALWDFMVEQRNHVHKEGGPKLTYTVTPVSVMEFIRAERAKIREVCCGCIWSILYRLHGGGLYLLLGADRLFCDPLCKCW
jgi:hypothetical protein